MAVELAVLAALLGIAPMARLLDHAVPPAAGLATAALAVPAVLGADRLHKAVRARRHRRVLAGGA